VDEYSLLYLLVGGLAGLLAGLFGIGGGIILVPLFFWCFSARYGSDLAMHLALGSSATVVLCNSLISGWHHHKKQAVNWLAVKWLAPGLLIGSIWGAALASHLSGLRLQQIFALFLVVLAAHLVWKAWSKPSRPVRLPQHPIKSWHYSLMGLVIGHCSGLLAIGGGSLTVPFLVLRQGFTMRHGVATAAVCGTPIALAASMTYGVMGAGQLGLPSLASGYLYWPAIIATLITSLFSARWGVALAHRCPNTVLQGAFALLLLVSAGLLWPY